MDLFTDAFYPSRYEIIQARLAEIEELSPEALLKDFRARYCENFGISCQGVQWDRHDLEELCQMVDCIGGSILSSVFKLFCEDYKEWSAGFPDLLLWNAETGTAKISEVKGPRDRLSDKQRAWIDALLCAGAQVEVCHVHEKASD